MSYYIFFFFNDPAPTEIYTLSLHDALPIFEERQGLMVACPEEIAYRMGYISEADLNRLARAMGKSAYGQYLTRRDRKSTRLNSSHRCISYAVFCLKKKKKKKEVK